MKLHLDIETGDPDDLWTLALMATHPKVDLQGVTVFPGGPDQVGLVKKILKLAGRSDVMVGANLKDDGKSRVSKFYTNWLGKIDPSEPDDTVLGVFKKRTSGCSLLTGGPLTNIQEINQHNQKNKRDGTIISSIFSEWTCQGGFVGNNIVPDEEALEKFRGMDAVPTFNLNGDPKAALALTDQIYNPFHSIRMVGKNVCHGFIFNKQDVERLPKGAHPGLDVMIDGMEFYCRKKPEGKAMHDILAALMHIAPQAGRWVSGQPVRRKGKWGFEEATSNIRALVGVDREAAIQELA
jgi:inosine-uridine nucleoside N-ribohydrolase